MNMVVCIVTCRLELGASFPGPRNKYELNRATHITVLIWDASLPPLLQNDPMKLFLSWLGLQQVGFISVANTYQNCIIQ